MKRIIKNGEVVGIEFENCYKEIDYNCATLYIGPDDGIFPDSHDLENVSKADGIKNPIYMSMNKDLEEIVVSLSYEDAVELQRYIGEVLAMADSARERYIAELEATINDLKQQSHD